MSLLLKGIARWWGTAQASNILVIVGGLLIAGLLALGIYVQQLRVIVAKCTATGEAKEMVERLADRIEDDENEKLDEALEEIDQAVHPCLDVPVADLLRSDNG